MCFANAIPLTDSQAKCEDYFPEPDLSHPLDDLHTQSLIMPIDEPDHNAGDIRQSLKICFESPPQNSTTKLGLQIVFRRNGHGVTRPETTLNLKRFQQICAIICIVALFVPFLLAGAFVVANYHIPESLDYREEGVVTPIKDERSCHSGPSFAAVACLESKYALLTGETLDLSEQHVLDCSKRFGNNSCHGGSPKSVLNFMQYYGVDTEANIPYKQLGLRKCRHAQMKYHNRILHWKSIDQNEEAMKTAIFKHGPIIASLTVDDTFRSYHEGVFTAGNNTNSNHVVLIVGYGNENGTDVWYIKNSWGENWGQGGFMTIQRNVNLRRIAEEAYAIVAITSAVSRSERVSSVGLFPLCFVATINAVIFTFSTGIR